MIRRGRFAAFVIAVCMCAAATFQAAEDNGVPVPSNALIVPWTRFSIQYTVRDIGNVGPKSVEFYMTDDMGKTWKRYGEDPDAKSPMLITVPGDGVYGFMTVGTDHVGNRERAPVSGTRPETVVIVDRTPPSAKWILPAKTQLLGGQGVELKWSASDPHLARSPVSIEYSTDSGRSWFPLKERLKANGTYTWRPDAALGATITFRLSVRDRAGNRLLLACPHRVLMDSTPPTIGVTGPAMSKELMVDITYVAEDKESGLARVTLYTTTDGGATWRRYGDDPDLESPMAFTTEIVGPIGIMPVATDKAGNISPLPRAGQEPPFTILFDNEAPLVHFDPQLPEGQRNLRGGETYAIRWKATDENIQSRSARLEFSDSGGDTWTTVGTDLPVNGPHTWTAPSNIDRRDCLLRVSVADSLGNVGSATTLQFSVDSLSPDTEITDVKPVGDDDDDSPRTTESVSTDSTADDETSHTAPRATYRISEDDDSTVPDLGRVPTFDDDDLTIPETPETKTNEDETGPAPVTNNTPPIPTDTTTIVEEAADVIIPGRPDTDETEGDDVIAALPTDTVEGSADVIDANPAATGVDWTNGETDNDDSDSTGTPPSSIGRTDTTEPVDDSVATARTGEADAIISKADDMFREGETTSVLTLCDKALEIDPQNAMAYDLKARVYYTLGDYAKSADNAARAVQYNRREEAHWNNLGEASYSNARELSKQIIMKRRSDNATAGEILDLSKERDLAIDRARNAFSQVIQLAPDEKKGHNRLGDTIYMHARLLTDVDSDRAAKAYRDAIASYKRGHRLGEPTYRETFQLGVSYYRLYEMTKDDAAMREAQRYLERSIEEAPADVVPKESYWYLAEIHQLQKEYPDSERYWQKVLDAYPVGSKFRKEAQRRIEFLQQVMP